MLFDSLAHEALLSAADKEIFVFQWLTALEKTVIGYNKTDLKKIQPKVTLNLQERLKAGHGPPNRRLLSNAFAVIYLNGDSYTMYDTISICLDLLKTKNDSPSYTNVRLGSVEILGCLYERLGRTAGGTFPDSLTALIKLQRGSDVATRCAALFSMRQMIVGLQNSASYGFKDMSKSFKSAMCDKNMEIR